MANSLGEDLEGKYVVLKRSYYKGDDPIERVFHCEGGFGCKSYTMGSAVVGTFVFDGEHVRAEGYEIERFATSEEVDIAKTKLEKSKKKLADQNIGAGI